MLNQTTASHFVAKHYLEKFTNEKGQIWIKDKQKGSLYSNAPKNTAVENYLYEIKEPITEMDIIYWETIFNNDKKFDKFSRELITLAISVVNEDYGSGKRLSQEDLFCIYETNFWPVYNKLLSGDICFYKNFVERKTILETFNQECYHNMKLNLEKLKKESQMQILPDTPKNKTLKQNERLKIEKNNTYRKKMAFKQLNSDTYSLYAMMTFILTQWSRTKK